MSDPTAEGDERNPWTRSGFLLSAGVVGLLLVLLVVVLVETSTTNNGQAQPQPPAGTAGPAVSAPTRPAGPGPTTIPATPPQDVSWQLYRSVALPVSASAGPHEITDSAATVYAHTPTGALMAAAHIPVRKLIAPDWRRVVAEQVADGPGRDAYVKLREQVTNDTVTPGMLGQIAGYKFVHYSPDTATIQIVTRFATKGTLQLTTLTVTWQDGDWRLVLQPDGADSPTAQSLNSLAGFTEWGGV
ncbi:hypothetical protein GCM10012275_60740 [Longimycelium tulufanense]|uniref:DUF8175 domain-containing protein n=1 Tax=Longimycelium tulufanense TaxID=907463 RepID=A0A8J3FX01_9PSEU|nr:hypothetical protein [Longimycelium tulufanense]GGM81980.1 hypothetical protein GCM10012275_60740 [Longimycelium tulufanense]